MQVTTEICRASHFHTPRANLNMALWPPAKARGEHVLALVRSSIWGRSRVEPSLFGDPVGH
jgi:hypothetical protein